MGGSWPTQFAKDAKIRKSTVGGGKRENLLLEKKKKRKFTVGNKCSREKVKGVAKYLFAEEIRCVTHGPNQPSQQKPKIKGWK